MHRILHCFLKFFAAAAIVAAAVLPGSAALAASSHSLEDEVEYAAELTAAKAAETCAARFKRDYNDRTLRFICGRRQLYVCNQVAPVATTLPDAMRDCIILRARRYD